MTALVKKQCHYQGGARVIPAPSRDLLKDLRDEYGSFNPPAPPFLRGIFVTLFNIKLL